MIHPPWLKVLLWIAGIALVLFLLDKLLLKMESRGWIYYRKRKPSRSSLGHAFLEVQSILEPSKEAVESHVILTERCRLS